MVLLIVFFFFQAEDGIRDVAVTGVQTCALPITARSLWHAVAQDCQTCSPSGAQRHKRMDCKDQFISEIADTAAHKIARQVIMTLQRRKEARPSRDDAGWANRWDEGGMPMHGEASAVWERDAERIKQCITEEVRTHPAWVN